MTLVVSVESATPGDHQDVAFTLPKAGRIAIGAGADRSDFNSSKAVSVDLKQGGTSLSGYPVTLDLDHSLDNVNSPAIDPIQRSHLSAELDAGDYTYSVTASTGSPTVEASGVNSPDDASGTVCGHTFSSHSHPTACKSGGVIYGIHAELDTGDRVLSGGGARIGHIANAIGAGQNEENDIHHTAGTITPRSTGGFVVSATDHNGVLRFLYSDTAAGLLSAAGTNLSPTSRRATYSQVSEVTPDEFMLHARVRDAGGLGHRVYFVDPDDPASFTQDVLGMSSTLAEQAYPVWIDEGEDDAGNPIRVVGVAPRATSTDWTGLLLLVWDSTQGANGRYYSTDGATSSTAALGTTSTPRITRAKYEAMIGSGGFRVIDNTGSGQVHIPGNFCTKVQNWSGGSGRVDALIPWVDAPTLGGFNDSTASNSDVSELRLTVVKGSTIITTTAGTDPVIPPFNTIRAGCCVIWKDGVPGGTALLFVTDIGNYSDGVTGNPYYKWGGPTIRLVEIEDPFGATSAGELADRIKDRGVIYTASGLTCANIDPVRGALNMVAFQEAFEGVTPVGRQSVLRTLEVGARQTLRGRGRDYRVR